MQDFDKVRRLLVIKHGAFGDVIQSLGALEDIRRNFPNANITVVSEPVFGKIFNRCSFVDQLINDARLPRWRIDAMLSLKREIMDADPEIIIDLQNSSRTEFYRRFLLKGPQWSFVENARSASAKFPKSMPSLVRLEGQLRDFGLEVKHSGRPDISWFANDVTDILDSARVQRPYVTLVPGCSARHPQKRWPYYKHLAQRLIGAGYEVVTVPGPDEMELCAEIPGKTLTGQNYLDWFDLAGVLRGAALVIGNDTGPTHIAVHLDRPGLALFGPHASALSTGMGGRRLQVIECSDLSALGVDEVFDRAIGLLSAHSNDV